MSVASAELFLVNQLTVLLPSLMRRSKPLLAMLGRRYRFSEEVSVTEDQGTALSCLFEAYVSLGGTIETAPTYPWEEQRGALLDAAYARFQREMRGPGSVPYDRRRRWGSRRGPSTTWDAWRNPGLESCAPPGVGLGPDVVPGEQLREWELKEERLPQEEAYLRQTLGALKAELEAVLPPQYYRLLRLHYLSGLPIDVIADRLGMSEARVRRTLSRARACARERLPGRWQALLKDLAA